MALTKVLLAAIVAVGLLGVTAACGSDTPDEQANPTQSARSSTSAAPKPKPTAADGTDTSACADGTCEVEIRVGQDIPMPAETTVKDLQATRIASDRVELAGSAEGGGMGGCYGRPPCDFSNNGGALTMTLGTSSTVVNNGYGLTVKGIGDGTAIISIEPVG